MITADGTRAGIFNYYCECVSYAHVQQGSPTDVYHTRQTASTGYTGSLAAGGDFVNDGSEMGTYAVIVNNISDGVYYTGSL